MFRITIKLILLLLLCMQTVHAQDLRTDLNKIVGKMDTSSQVSVEVKVNAYSKKGGAVFYTTNASFYKSGKNTFTRLGEQDYLVTPAVEVTVDNEEKAMLVLKKEDAPKNKKGKTEKVKFDFKEFEKYLDEDQVKAEISLVSSSNGLNEYKITNVPEITEMRIVINVKSNSIDKVTYHYKDESQYKGQYIVLDYTKFSYSENNSAKLNPANYYSEMSGKIVGVGKYKSYNLYKEL